MVKVGPLKDNFTPPFQFSSLMFALTPLVAITVRMVTIMTFVFVK